MKKIYLFFLAALFVGLFHPLFAQQDTVLIDFGSAAVKSAQPWNNVTSIVAADEVSPLYNSDVEATPYGIKVTDGFTGTNTAGTTSPDPLLDLPSSATSDSHFGNIEAFNGVSEPTGGYQFTGLNPSKSYKFIFFGSRTATDNRETKYTLDGITTASDSLNAASNTANVAEITMTPKADGTINLIVSPGLNNNNANHFYYIGAVKIVYESEVFAQPAITLSSPNGGESFVAGETHTISWTAANLYQDIIVSYSMNNGTDWTDIDTLASSATSLDWIIPEIPGNQYLVKASSWLTEDASDATFTILGELPDNDTISIDFGAATALSTAPWNNLPGVDVSEEVIPLLNANNKVTQYGMRVIDKFTGVNEAGTTTPAGVLGIPVSASKDSYFGNIEIFSGSIEPTAGLQFSGFKPGKDYTFILFASRTGVSDNRETKYKFEGNVTDSVYLNPSNNVANYAEITISAKADGTIDLLLSPGENNNNANHFYYIGAIKIIYAAEEPLPSTITVDTPNGGEDWLIGSVHNIEWSGINLGEDVIVSYSIDNGTNWTNIDTVLSGQKTLAWTVPGFPSSQCLVRITSGATVDVSDANFGISSDEVPAVILIQPNGGESWIAGSTQMIKWTPNKLTEDITIKYSTDNGLNWTSLGSVGPDSSFINWTIPQDLSSECLVIVQSGTIADTSFSTFSIVEPVCSNTIVVLGSSTAAGTGASPVDSAWVWRYAAALKAINPNYKVVNLGLGGYNTFQIVPTGTTFAPGISETIDVNRNVTKALTYSPYAIIVNMPSNDANKNYTSEQTLANLKLVSDYANANGVEAWIATTQPRNFSTASQLETQKYLSTAIMDIYGDYAIDFWTGIAAENSFIIAQYNSGDGVHLNNAGHRVLFERVMGKEITRKACNPTNVRNFENSTSDIMVYPNPSNDEFTLTFTTESAAKVEIRFYDLAGRVLDISKADVENSGFHNLSFSGKKISRNSAMIIAAIKIDEIRGTSLARIKIAINGR